MQNPAKCCSIDGCAGPTVARGWCKKHYQRWAKWGDPLKGRDGTKTGALRAFLEEAKLYEGADCVLWPFATAGKGYAVMPVGGKTVYAHVVMCTEVSGPAPTPKHEVAHSCGWGHIGCVAPRHLRWATRSENHQDKRAHGTAICGEVHPDHKLTTAEVLEIRSRYATGGISQRLLGLDYGVTQTTVGAITRRKAWRHVS